MKFVYKTIIIFSICACSSILYVNIFAKQKQSIKSVNNLQQLVDEYISKKGKRIDLILKLSYFSTGSFKTWQFVFYDENNHDIKFFVTEQIEKNRLYSDVKTLHRGMKYLVSFVVDRLTVDKQIKGTLIRMRPIILREFP